MQSLLISATVLLLIILLIRVLHGLQEKQSKASIDKSTPLPPLDAAASTTPRPIQVNNEKSHWLDEIKQCRKEGEYVNSLTLCQKNFPKQQAFQQAMLTLRAEIRSLEEDSPQWQTKLAALYQTAAIANLFRQDAVLKPAANANSLDRLLQKLMTEVELPYSEIGYTQLKLLTKSDIRLLESRWSSPAQHQHSEEFLGNRWQKLINESA